jgi:hypothetical protein
VFHLKTLNKHEWLPLQKQNLILIRILIVSHNPRNRMLGLRLSRKMRLILRRFNLFFWRFSATFRGSKCSTWTKHGF